jgi:ABC-type cobalamin/Fe3+-siderophores transport system ATPase subunit
VTSSEAAIVNHPIFMPDGEEIPGIDPVIIIGPNGSGKTRLSRQISVGNSQREYVNALRNTRISAQLPVMSKQQAMVNHQGQRGQAESTPWEIVTDFDYVLAQLLADDGDAARSFRDDVKSGKGADLGSLTALESVESLWSKVFEGRSLRWEDWAPLISNEAHEGGPYSANQMSDGERAALYLVSKVMLTAQGSVIFVDEPETHFHSLLAIRLWDELERRRRDLRFVYITHDLAFALSRVNPTYLIANPSGGLQRLDLDEEIPDEVRGEILGAASFSYYASRTVFCEGETQSYDARFFTAWFSGRDTAVFPVGSCELVRQCVIALARGGFSANANPLGIIDRDYRPDEYFAALGSDIRALPLHEIEGIVCLPEVIEVLRQHLAKEPVDVASVIVSTLREDVVLKVAHERWKLRVLNSFQDAVTARPVGVFTEEGLDAHVRNVGDTVANSIDLTKLLNDEIASVWAVANSGDVKATLRMFPSKAIAGKLASALGQTVDGLFMLVVGGLSAERDDDPLKGLGSRLETVFEALGLPARRFS